jgi:peptidoglycan lytic transglycosylase G
VKKFAVLVGLLVMAGAAGGWWTRERLATPYRGFEGADVFVDLPSGLGVSGIAARLADAGVVADAWTFRLAVRLAGSDRRLQAGEYRFAGAATPGDVAARLARGDVFTRSVTFPEGLTTREMSAIFERAGLGPRDAFLAAASDASPVSGFDPDARTLEGYLFPDTYALGRGAGAEALVRSMVAGFERAWTTDLRMAAAADRFDVRDLVTLASLIEKETARADERPLVSAVYRNRLKIGMALQCDPTVIYALAQAGRWNGNLRREDLQFKSPYNTYRYPGLPPGPIASPGRAAIVAAVHPANVPYLYFVSRNDGSHAFATTLAEHNRNVARWQGKRK